MKPLQVPLGKRDLHKERTMRLSSIVLKGTVGGAFFLATFLTLRLSGGAEEQAKPAAVKKAEDKAALTPAPASELNSVAFEFGASADAQFILAGRDARRQLLVTGAFSNSATRDLT